MTLIAAGDNLRNKSLMGLQAMSREEAEREALYQQMVQQKAAQRSQLAGTGLGIGASYAVNNPDKVAALSSKIFGGGQAAGLNLSAPSAAGIQQALASTKAGASIGQAAGTAASGTLEAGVANALANTGTTGASSFLSGSGAAGLSATAPAAQVASGAAATGEALAASTAAANSAVAGGGTAATAATGTAATSAGTMATLGAIAAPLAIGVGAFYLLNKLFD